ncbi:hypothetical protein PC120_g22999 [Phytophthora cactorum]|nr:hypothetical protein PC120_g22999 [Phytophthora cactorum]
MTSSRISMPTDCLIVEMTSLASTQSDILTRRLLASVSSVAFSCRSLETSAAIWAARYWSCSASVVESLLGTLRLWGLEQIGE